MEPHISPYRIVSLDGGGIRGIYQAVLIQRISEQRPAFLPSVRFFAGTSIGAINALSLARGSSPRELVEFFKRHGAKVFSDSTEDNIHDIGRVIGADYDLDYLHSVLAAVFGNDRLGSLNKRVLVPTVDLDNEGTPRRWKMKFFHNFPGGDDDGQEQLIDVALRSSAAPTYFPTYHGYIDGGVACNSPSMAAVCAAINPMVGRQLIASLRVLSISTGSHNSFISGNTHDWGYAQWARLLVPLMIDANTGMADYQCRQILGEHYHRLAPPLARQIATDDVGAIDELIGLAQAVDLSDALVWLDQFFSLKNWR